MNPLKLSIEEIEKIKSELIQQQIDLASASWEFKPIKKDIKSSIIHPADGKISIVRAESEIACSPQELFDYLVTNIGQTCKEWNDVAICSAPLKKYSNTVKISRYLSEGSIVADREDVFIQCTEKSSNGHIYELSRGFNETFIPIDTSVSKYTVRGIMYFASKEFIAIDHNKCLYKTIWHCDPSGWLSKLIPKKMLGGIILKNLVHEHQKISTIFKEKMN